MADPRRDLERTILTEDEIQTRVREMADQISTEFSDVDELYLIGILKGAFIFLADLARHLRVANKVDFMALSSYGMTAESTGEVRIIMDLREPIEDKHVIIVEDIVDSGNTLNYLQRLLRGRRPATLKSCVLLRKEHNSLDAPVDYLGFKIPNIWVVGYGLDFADTYRTLPFIAELKKEIYQK